MSNPLTTPQVIEAPRHLIELLNVAHERPFSLLLANYSWLLGAAGGVTLIWVVYAWLGKRNWPSYRLAMPITVVLILVAFLNVLAEVEQPSRLLYGYVNGWNYWDTAIIKYGIILLPIYLMLAWWLMFQSLDRTVLGRTIGKLPSGLRPLADFFSLWSRRYSIHDRPRLEKTALGIIFLVGLFAPLYSGIFLMNEHGVPVWNSPAQAFIFLGTGVAKGAVLLMLLVPLLDRLATGERTTVNPELRPVAGGAMVLSAIIWLGWMWWLGRFGTIAELRAADLFMGPYGTAVFWNWIFPGIIVPLAVYFTPLRRHKTFCYITAIGILWASYAVRVIIMIGGQALNRSGAGFLTFSPNTNTLWYTGFSVAFLIGLLSLLLLLLPLSHTRQEEILKGGVNHG